MLLCAQFSKQHCRNGVIVVVFKSKFQTGFNKCRLRWLQTQRHRRRLDIFQVGWDIKGAYRSSTILLFTHQLKSVRGHIRGEFRIGYSIESKNQNVRSCNNNLLGILLQQKHRFSTWPLSAFDQEIIFSHYKPTGVSHEVIGKGLIVCKHSALSKGSLK